MLHGPPPVGRMAALTATASRVKLRHRARSKPHRVRGEGGDDRTRHAGYQMLGGIIRSYELALGLPHSWSSRRRPRGILSRRLGAGLSSSRREDGDGRGRPDQVDGTPSLASLFTGHAVHGGTGCWISTSCPRNRQAPSGGRESSGGSGGVGAGAGDYAVRVGPSVERGQRGGWRVADENFARTCRHFS